MASNITYLHHVTLLNLKCGVCMCKTNIIYLPDITSKMRCTSSSNIIVKSCCTTCRYITSKVALHSILQRARWRRRPTRRGYLTYPLQQCAGVPLPSLMLLAVICYRSMGCVGGRFEIWLRIRTSAPLPPDVRACDPSFLQRVPTATEAEVGV